MIHSNTIAREAEDEITISLKMHNKQLFLGKEAVIFDDQCPSFLPYAVPVIDIHH
jgi:hypothetical protein